MSPSGAYSLNLMHVSNLVHPVPSSEVSLYPRVPAAVLSTPCKYGNGIGGPRGVSIWESSIMGGLRLLDIACASFSTHCLVITDLGERPDFAMSSSIHAARPPPLSPEDRVRLSKDDLGPTILGVTVAFTSIAFIAVSLRCYSRIRLIKIFGVEDWFMVISMVRITKFIRNTEHTPY